jgi:shikimate kinase
MTVDRSKNIILIGMPGSGKSTIGVLLAKQMGFAFADTDVLIQIRCSRSLQEIVDRDGHLELRRIEERVIAGLDLRQHVIATGGSAVYSDRAMQHLGSGGIVVFLNVDLALLKKRVHDYDTRGLAKRPDQTVDDLFAERHALYRKYADVTIDCMGLNHEQVVEKIIKEVNSRVS